MIGGGRRITRRTERKPSGKLGVEKANMTKDKNVQKKKNKIKKKNRDLLHKGKKSSFDKHKKTNINRYL